MKKLISVSSIILIISGISFSMVDAKMAAPMSSKDIGKTLVNPNPPSNDFDKRAVEFSESMLRKLVFNIDNLLVTQDAAPADASQNNQKLFKRPTVKLNINATSLAQSESAWRSGVVETHAVDFMKTISSLKKIKNGHVIPWAYERYKQSNKNKTKDLEIKQASSLKQKRLDSMKLAPMADLMEQTAVIEIAPELADDEFMVHFHVLGEDNNWYHVNVILGETVNNELLFKRFFATPVSMFKQMPPGVLC